MPFANRASFLFAPQDATAFSTKSKTWSRSSLSRVKVLVRSPSSENSRIPRETETDLASLKRTVSFCPDFDVNSARSSKILRIPLVSPMELTKEY